MEQNLFLEKHCVLLRVSNRCHVLFMVPFGGKYDCAMSVGHRVLNYRQHNFVFIKD